MARKGSFEKFHKKKKVAKAEVEEPGRKPKSGKGPKRAAGKPRALDSTEPVRLNKYIAQSGVCSRREADTLIKAGRVKVNGKVCKEMGVKVKPGSDRVEYLGKVLSPQNFTYFLMNKPKNHITTVKDEHDRKTVMDVIKHYTQERIYPVGRLDRNTTGLLLFTNDGQLAEKMTHPSFRVKKVYHVKVDKPMLEDHVYAMKDGITLEDGLIKVDKMDVVERGGPDEIGVEIHSGRNRIVRRMFEHFGYQVLRLDRVAIGPLTKKNLPRGRCRALTDKEVSFLKMM